MPRYELWSVRDGEDKLLLSAKGLTIDHAKTEFETLISRWEEEMATWFTDTQDDIGEESFLSTILPGAEEGCDFVLKDEQGKSLFHYTHEWEVVR